MTDSDLTPNEALVLLVLMAESREVSNPELKALGPELRVAGRNKLNSLGLIESNVDVRPFTHTLTDRGWATAADLIGSAAPAGSFSPAKALFTVLAGLRRHFDRNDLRASEVFLPESSDPASSIPSDAGTDVEALITHAYADLASSPGAWVRLARLRPALPDLSRDDFDRALIALQRRSGVSLIPEENQKTITAEDREAAVFLGNQNNHLFSIEAR
ncbi:hypothetical protein ABH922_003233 [Rhodococcus sp. 27YEA15]|uniref:hypothetical protein n=1 Tax=Rhodococcus sp. 27YEA15 TaxID=3156259 RepID=UPI003C7DFC20